MRYWKCAVSRIQYCPGSAKQTGPDDYQAMVGHNHEPNEVNPVVTFRKILKDRATRETVSLRHIYDEESIRLVPIVVKDTYKYYLLNILK